MMPNAQMIFDGSASIKNVFALLSTRHRFFEWTIWALCPFKNFETMTYYSKRFITILSF